MKKYFFIFPCLILLLSCRHEINYDNVIIKDGLYVDSATQKVLNGKYKSITPPDHELAKEDVITFEFSDGIPVGEWADTYGGELIHSGKYLDEEYFAVSIKELAKCKRVDLNLWKEGDYQFLTLELIYPIETDSLTLQKIIEQTISGLYEKYKFSEIIIDSIGASTKNYIYEYNIE